VLTLIFSVETYRVEGMKAKNTVVHEAFEAMGGWKMLGKYGTPRFLWTWRLDAAKSVPEFTYCNHIESVKAISSKDGLVKSMLALHDGKFPDFIPVSWLYPSQRLELFELEGVLSGPIIEKAADQARGIGIKYIQSGDQWLREEKQKFMASCTEEDCSPEEETRSTVIQKYVENPHLIYGFKYDIRQFMVVTDLCNGTAYLYDDFYIRMASQHFNLHDDTPSVHLTNHQIQKDDPNFAGTIAGNQLSKKAYMATNQINPEWWKDVIDPQIQKIARTLVEAWKNSHVSSGNKCRDRSFELLGLDIIVDANWHLWLLEANDNPGLHLLTPIVNVHHREALKSLLPLVLGGGEGDAKDVPRWKVVQ